MPGPVPGYHGKYLRVDLTRGLVTSVEIPASVIRAYIGGTGLGSWILMRETGVEYSPTDPQAPIVFSFSPLVGSAISTSAKFAMLCKSPLTRRLNDSLSSSSFALTGKKTGFDALVIVGASNAPGTLVIDSGVCTLEPADEIWGMTATAATEHIKGDIGSRFQIAAIGRAGENGVAYATVSHESRHAGRGGLGAVLGAKNLKAVAVAGTQPVRYSDPRGLVELSRDLSARSLGPATEKYRELGTVSNLVTFNRIGALPTRNFQEGVFEEASSLAPEQRDELLKRTRASCASCAIGCEHIFHTERRPEGTRMEYENLFALGPLCGIRDPELVWEASAVCDELGLDTISAGATVAFAMECAERGMVDAPGLRFGDGEQLIKALRAIAEREGIGELLSLGSRGMSERIGQGSEDFAPHVKGLEIPGYDPRALQTMALGFAVGTRGADHNRSGAYEVDFSTRVDRLDVGIEAVAMAIETENEAAIMDSLIMCKFLRAVFDDRMSGMAGLLRPTTGWELTAKELHETASRIVNTRKFFNIRQGWGPAEDTLPRRFLSSAIPDGASRGAVLDEARLRRMIAEYNCQRGWSVEGWLSPEQMEEIQGLADEKCETTELNAIAPGTTGSCHD